MNFKRLEICLTLITCLVINPYSVFSAPQTHQRPRNEFSDSSRPSPYKNGTRESADGDSELFGYPAEPSTIEAMRNARNRTPVYLPAKCLENEILYPGDQESDWVCDCMPTYVFHPPNRKCYQMYTQGYCENGTMIYLALNAKKPECIPNDCHRPGESKISWVRFGGKCVRLNEFDDICRKDQLRQFVGVSETTHELVCINELGENDLRGKTSPKTNPTTTTVYQ